MLDYVRFINFLLLSITVPKRRFALPRINLRVRKLVRHIHSSHIAQCH